MVPTFARVFALDLLLRVFFARELRILEVARIRFCSLDGYWRFAAIGEAEDVHRVILETPMLGIGLASRLRAFRAGRFAHLLSLST